MSELLIKSKGEFFELCAAGKLGNTPQTWSSLEACLAEIRDTKRLVYLTSDSWKNKPVYWQNWIDLDDYQRNPEKLKAQFPWGKVYAAENPDAKLQQSVSAFQFDLVVAERWMIWNVSNETWGGAKRAGHYTVSEGAVVPVILRHHLGDYISDLEEVMERFPTATIEATLFPFRFGSLNRNLLFWEIRHY